MTTTDYIINAVLVLLVVRQIREQRLDLRALAIPLVLVVFAGHSFLRTIPSAGNDLVLIGALTALGITFGVLAGLFTEMRRGDDGLAWARAGWIAASLWIGGIGMRMGFAFMSDHGLGPAIHSFSVANNITSGHAWTAAFVLMALAEVTSRVLTLGIRAQQVSGGALLRPLAARI